MLDIEVFFLLIGFKLCCIIFWDFNTLVGRIILTICPKNLKRKISGEKINEDQSFKDEIYNIICDKRIMEYRDPNSKIDENIEEDDSVDED